MTGSGTQTDPYIINADDTLSQKWSDFIKAIGTNYAYVQCPADIWDMNEIYPDGWNKKIGIGRDVVIYGNGLTIMNLYSTCSDTDGLFSSYYGYYVYDLNFEDLFFSGSKSVFGSSNDDLSHGVYFYNCKFNGIINSGNFLSGYRSFCFYVHNKGCSIKLKFNNSSNFFEKSNSKVFIRSGVVEMTGNSMAECGSSSLPLSLTNCLMCGRLPFSKITIAGRNNIIDMNISEEQSILQSSELVANIINSNKIATGATIATSLIQVAESQMNDAVYLDSIGFPIGVD